MRPLGQREQAVSQVDYRLESLHRCVRRSHSPSHGCGVSKDGSYHRRPSQAAAFEKQLQQVSAQFLSEYVRVNLKISMIMLIMNTYNRYLSCTSARPIGAEVDDGLTSVGPTDSAGETQQTEPTIDSASSLQIVLVSLRTLLASKIIN